MFLKSFALKNNEISKHAQIRQNHAPYRHKIGVLFGSILEKLQKLRSKISENVLGARLFLDARLFGDARLFRTYLSHCPLKISRPFRNL